MNPDLEYIVKLQKLEDHIKELEEVKGGYPGKVKALEREFEYLKSELEEKEAEILELDRERIKKEKEIAEENAKINRAQERINTIKTNKEYQALLKELEIAKQIRIRKEDEILTILIRIDELKNEIEAKKRELEMKREEIESMKKEASSKLEDYDASLQNLLKEKEELMKRISPNVLKIYSMIKDRSNGLVVVPVNDGYCTGCNLNVPPQIYNEVLKNDKMVFCPNCNRILYIEKERE